jgi:molybdenum cofactor biosynthesis enzyme MoaA
VECREQYISCVTNVTELMYNLDNLTAWVDLSTYCNAACPLCHRTNPKTLEKANWLPLVQWSLEQFQQAFPVTVLHQYKYFEICGTWGDPVMNKDLLAIVEYLITHSAAIVMVKTNGSIREPDWWWNLGVIGGRRLRVMFAVEGIDQEMHSLYRQNTSLSKIRDNVAAIAATQAKVQIKVLVFKHNEQHLQQIHDMVHSWGKINKIVYTKAERFDTGSTFTFGDGLQLEQCS